MLIGTVHNRNEYIHDVDVNIGYRRIQLHQPHQELDALLRIIQFQKSGHFLIEKERALCRLDSTHNNIKNHTNRTPLWEPFATPSNSPRFLDFQISGLFSNVSISYYFFIIIFYLSPYLHNQPNLLDQFHQSHLAHPRDSIHRGFIPQRAQDREFLRGNGESVEGRVVPASPRGSCMSMVETWIPVRTSR